MLYNVIKCCITFSVYLGGFSDWVYSSTYLHLIAQKESFPCFFILIVLSLGKYSDPAVPVKQLFLPPSNFKKVALCFISSGRVKTTQMHTKSSVLNADFSWHLTIY